MHKKVCEDQCKMKIPEEFNAVKQGLPLTNRVRGPYCKLGTEFFSRSVYGPSAKHAGHKLTGKKRGSVTYSTDRENEVSKIFILILRLIGRAEKEIFKVSGPYSKVRPAKLINHSARTN